MTIQEKINVVEKELELATDSVTIGWLIMQLNVLQGAL